MASVKFSRLLSSKREHTPVFNFYGLKISFKEKGSGNEAKKLNWSLFDAPFISFIFTIFLLYLRVKVCKFNGLEIKK